MDRTATITRQTKETEIKIHLNIDGTGRAEVNTSIPFMDHMLELFCLNSRFDLRIEARGDTQVDLHHLVEDLGICLGEAFKEALGEKKGIQRYGHITLPMDEALVRVALDLSNRPYLAYQVGQVPALMGGFDIRLLKEFFRALCFTGGITLHFDLIRGEEPHHIAEAIFKAFGRAISCAVKITGPDEVPSTKGVL